MCLSGDCASCFTEVIPSRLLPPHVLHLDKTPVPLTLLCGPAILTIRELALLKAGTELTSYLPKRKGSAASYPGRIGERNLTVFLHLLPLLSRRKAFWTRALKEGNPAESVANVAFARAASVKLLWFPDCQD